MVGGVQSVRRIAAVVAFAALISAMLAVSASAEDLGPPVATKAPDIGTRLDQTGKPRTLAALMGRNCPVLMFFRSAVWCPFCQPQLIGVNIGVSVIDNRSYLISV